ncbi:hypothetical protein T492DRAFT_868485 [Pavlovales sp. CCMP2436]|nr:hypothetical protein T492DRAFT_868485 [Pavlovales sp. CCMP2436]
MESDDPTERGEGHLSGGLGGDGMPRDASGSIKGRLYSYGVQKPNALLNRPVALKPRPPGAMSTLSGLLPGRDPGAPPGSPLPKALLSKPLSGSGRMPGSSAQADMNRSFGDNLSSFAASRPLGAALADSHGAGKEAEPIPVAQLKRKADEAELAKVRIAEEFKQRRADEVARSKRKGAGGGAYDATQVAKDAALADSGAGGDEKQTRRNDPFWFIQMLRTFAYMNVADSEGTSFDPYNLRIVPFNEVRGND